MRLYTRKEVKKLLLEVLNKCLDVTDGEGADAIDNKVNIYDILEEHDEKIDKRELEDE